MSGHSQSALGARPQRLYDEQEQQQDMMRSDAASHRLAGAAAATHYQQPLKSYSLFKLLKDLAARLDPPPLSQLAEELLILPLKIVLAARLAVLRRALRPLRILSIMLQVEELQ
ncbi:hypothetical protein GOP47_0004463 [Adiantum capillus-veneris]|uniref:Uncharacterized protein n=1 Tax=Adiantum capillus-veneris TaxID=13818 RepID=A0A9D4ZQD1_ADICA|nr:hypothetical protein GOP47_0004463 [Adiantum capillus-veneris]